jgi:hypothetical protein
MKNVIEIGKKYFMHDTTVVALAYLPENGVLMVKETDGNLFFVLDEFTVVNEKLISKNAMSFTVTEKEMLDCINSYITANSVEKVTKDIVVTAIRNTYYKIPTKIAEVVAEWYLK